VTSFPSWCGRGPRISLTPGTGLPRGPFIVAWSTRVRFLRSSPVRRARSSTASSKGVLIDDAQVFNDKLAEWQDFCTYHRPHGSLGGAREWEMTRYRAYQAQLAGQPVGATFRRAAAFLRLAAEGSSLSRT
jgi:hypothetical protein